MANVGHINVPIHRPIEVFASKELIEAIEGLRVPHLVVDGDCWYSCPLALHEDGSSESCNDDERERGICSCNASAHNAKVDALIESIRFVAAMP